MSQVTIVCVQVKQVMGCKPGPNLTNTLFKVKHKIFTCDFRH